jgi:hypothetical protein
MKTRYVVAVKDTATGTIRPGKVLAKYRNLADARRDHHKLARQENKDVWKIGIFLDGKILG